MTLFRATVATPKTKHLEIDVNCTVQSDNVE